MQYNDFISVYPELQGPKRMDIHSWNNCPECMLPESENALT